jgi:acetyl esterase/lipase
VTDPSFISASERDLLVVTHDRDEAEAAARALLDAGVPAEDVLVDRP